MYCGSTFYEFVFSWIAFKWMIPYIYVLECIQLHRAIFLRFLFLKVFESYLLWKIVCTSFVAYKLKFIYLCIPVCIKPQLMQFVQFSNSILNLRNSQNKMNIFEVRQGFKAASFIENGPMQCQLRPSRKTQPF